ncbi:MAG: hypothetical protein Q7J78_00780, partial [Clostridiales bacterium]|nr:hypothetical protein [Clostridiales bacterium]
MKKWKKLLALMMLVAMIMTLFVMPAQVGAFVSDSKICENLKILKGDDSGVSPEYLAYNSTRLQAAIISLRLSGKENEALNFTGSKNFTDAGKLTWQDGKNILAYLKANPQLGWVGLPNGSFGPNDKIDAKAMHKVMLEILGYKQDVDFTYDDVIDFAKSLGFSRVVNASPFTNTNISSILVETLKMKMKAVALTLVQNIINRSIISNADAVKTGLIAAPMPITLTIGIGSTLDDGIHQEYSVLKEITKQTGVTLSFVTYDGAKFKVLMAGGDLPDLISMSSTPDAINLAESGALLQLDDLLDKFGQNIKNNIPIALKYSKTVIGKGKTYLLSIATSIKDTSSPMVNGGLALCTRYDIYKAVGSPKMSGEDDYLKVLKQMQDYQRKATNNTKIYAISAWTDWGMFPVTINYPFAYGYVPMGASTMMNLATEEIESMYFDQEGVFWRGLKFFNKAYRMGIYDPEGFTMKYAQYETKVKNGIVLTAGNSSIEPDTAVCGDKAVLVHLPGAFPILDHTYYGASPTGYGVNGARAINISAKYPERIMQLLNYFDSEDGARTLWNGVKGVDWDVVDGEAQLIGPRLEARRSGKINEYEKKYPSGILGESFAALGARYTSGEWKTSDGLPLNLMNTAKQKEQSATPAQKSFAQDFGLTYPGQVYDKWIKEGLAINTPELPLA